MWCKAMGIKIIQPQTSLPSSQHRAQSVCISWVPSGRGIRTQCTPYAKRPSWWLWPRGVDWKKEYMRQMKDYKISSDIERKRQRKKEKKKKRERILVFKYLFVEDRLGLTSETFLFSSVTTSSLSSWGLLSLLVLGNLVQSVLAALLAGAERLLGLREGNLLERAHWWSNHWHWGEYDALVVVIFADDALQRKRKKKERRIIWWW